MIVDGTVGSDDITNNSITSLDLANSAVTSAKILNSTISTDDLADNAVSASKISPDIISTIDGVSNDAGNIDFVAGANVTITPDDANNQITFSATSSNLWNQSGSNIYYNTGNVGIGTTSPLYPLTIMPGTSNRGLFIDHNQSGAGSTYGLLVDLDRTGTGNADAYGVWTTATNDNGLWSTRGLMSTADGNSTGPKYGVFAVAQGLGSLYGVKGVANSLGMSSQYGLWGEAIGTGNGVHYGVYGTASGGGTLWAGYFNGNTYIDGNLGIGTISPINKLHIEEVDLALQSTDLLNELVTVEDLDAGLGLYSAADGNYGSLVSMGEIAAGSLNNKWTMYRTTSIANPANQLRFSFGSNIDYNQNPAWLTISENGNVGIGGVLQPTTDLEVAASGTNGIHINGDDSGDARYSIENGGGFHFMFDDDSDAHAFKFESASGRDLAFNTNGPTERMRITSSGNVGIGTTSPSANLHVSGIDGFLSTGTFSLGSIPVENAGTRLMWYPAKAAFRAGMAGFDQWNDSNIGDYSVAMGLSTIASGNNSTAFGMSTTAGGQFSTAMGNNTSATANLATALGSSTTASGISATAMGSNTTASGSTSTAMGSYTTASGSRSTTMGNYIQASGSGSFAIGDFSTTTAPNFTTNNRFYARFAGGYRLYTNSGLTSGAQLLAGANSWSTLSDSTKKEKFIAIDGEDVLRKIRNFNLTSWNYIGQDPAKFRHYGPMAQDFYAAFGHDGIGTIGNDTTISSADFDGINLIAIQALEKRTAELNKKVKLIENLQVTISSLKEENSELKKKLLSLEQFNKKVEVILSNLEKTQKSNSTEITLSNLK